MATNALTAFSASSSPPVLSKKAFSGPLAAGLGSLSGGLGPLGVGLGPRSVKLPTSSRGRSLVVKADQDQPGYGYGSPNISHSPDSWHHNRIALLSSPRYMRNPLRHHEIENGVEIAYDMPGYMKSETAAEIRGDILYLYGRDPDDDTRFMEVASCQLPDNSDASKARAVLEYGVLKVTVPKNDTLNTIYKVPIN